LKVAVGSTNPVKIQAVMEAFQETFNEVEVIGIKADSHVSNQPFKEKVIEGSVNRAEESLKRMDVDFGVGIEGGIIQLGERWYNLGFVAIVDRDGKIGTGTSGLFECPPTIIGQLKRGRELGEVVDDLTGRVDTKKQEGAIGVFTKGKVSRKDLYKHGVFMALVPFLSPELFRDEG
jgi:inosine/xanthosine triphosphatase